MPMTTPARSAHGAVPNLPSIQYPTSANPAVAPASSKPAPEYFTQPGNRRFSGTVPVLCEMIHAIRAFLKRPGCACEHFFRSTDAYWGPSADAPAGGLGLFFSFHSETSPSVSGNEIYRTDSRDANRLSSNCGRLESDGISKLIALCPTFPERFLDSRSYPLSSCCNPAFIYIICRRQQATPGGPHV